MTKGFSDAEKADCRKEAQLRVDPTSYFNFDLIRTNTVNGEKEALAHGSEMGSGGEQEIPFHLIHLLSLANQLKTKDRNPAKRNTLRTVFIDEAFKNSDDDKVSKMMDIIEDCGLQPVMVFPTGSKAERAFRKTGVHRRGHEGGFERRNLVQRRRDGQDQSRDRRAVRGGEMSRESQEASARDEIVRALAHKARRADGASRRRLTLYGIGSKNLIPGYDSRSSESCRIYAAAARSLESEGAIEIVWTDRYETIIEKILLNADHREAIMQEAGVTGVSEIQDRETRALRELSKAKGAPWLAQLATDILSRTGGGEKPLASCAAGRLDTHR